MNAYETVTITFTGVTTYREHAERIADSGDLLMTRNGIYSVTRDGDGFTAHRLPVARPRRGWVRNRYDWRVLPPWLVADSYGITID